MKARQAARALGGAVAIEAELLELVFVLGALLRDRGLVGARDRQRLVALLGGGRQLRLGELGTAALDLRPAE